LSDYDVIVLGGGSAGTAAAAAASEAGARTVMVNDGELGGLCLLRGCMPTKSMLAAAHATHEAEHTEPFGVTVEGPVVPDFARIMERKDRHVARFKKSKVASVEASDYDVLFARGRFVEGGGVEVDGRVMSAAGYVIATGSVTTRAEIPGIDTVQVWDSDDVMRLKQRPERLIVLGAGAVGLELAQFFARIGTQVLLVNRSALLTHHDLDCGAELTRALGDEPRLELAVPGSIDSLEPAGPGLRAHVRGCDGVRQFVADALLVAVGRRPAIDDLGLEHVGLSLGPDGCLPRDEQMRTDNPAIFVAGDTTGCRQILHLANLEGDVGGHNAAGGLPARSMDYRLEMQVIFTEPPFAQVGVTVDQARAAGLDVVTSSARFPETGRAITMGIRHGIWKLVADRASGEILGTSIVGPRADDLAHLISTIMYFRGKIDDIRALPWYHPTLAEVMIDLCRGFDSRP
jgi:pyruvate/2-oxoglutarate dehydrogenase complex dihydrolipoamide dehydrogenase (E3) component